MKSFLSQLTQLDYGFIALFGLGLIVGVRKGLLKMSLSTLALAGAVLISFHYYSEPALKISSNTAVPRCTAEALVFVLLAVVSWAIVNILLKVLGKIAEIHFSEQVNRLGGFAVGGLWAALLWGFVIYALISFKAPFFDPRLAGDSFFTPGAVRIPLEIYKFIFHSLPPAPSV